MVMHFYRDMYHRSIIKLCFYNLPAVEQLKTEITDIDIEFSKCERQQQDLQHANQETKHKIALIVEDEKKNFIQHTERMKFLETSLYEKTIEFTKLDQHEKDVIEALNIASDLHGMNAINYLRMIVRQQTVIRLTPI